MRRKSIFYMLFLLGLVAGAFAPLTFAQKNAVVFLTDFGEKDGAVSAMKGVAFGVDSSLALFDVTHEIPPFDIWEAAYRLNQTAIYWPKGTVFVCVVDPGVGTDRRAVVLKTTTGHFFVSPDNGTLTLVAEQMGIEAIRTIDEKRHRLKGSELSHTFHGRDLFAYAGARLAAGLIDLSQIGPILLPGDMVAIVHQKAELHSGILSGTIPVLDQPYGNVWTNIGNDLFQEMDVRKGDLFCVQFHHGGVRVYSGKMPYKDS
ncbi:MAG: SAM-dependent chlorinase/fluorinase, partial [Desulfobacterales bacterium]